LAIIEIKKSASVTNCWAKCWCQRSRWISFRQSCVSTVLSDPLRIREQSGVTARPKPSGVKFCFNAVRRRPHSFISSRAFPFPLIGWSTLCYDHRRGVAQLTRSSFLFLGLVMNPKAGRGTGTGNLECLNLGCTGLGDSSSGGRGFGGRGYGIRSLDPGGGGGRILVCCRS
jgi:hypothetical protein